MKYSKHIALLLGLIILAGLGYWYFYVISHTTKTQKSFVNPIVPKEVFNKSVEIKANLPSNNE